MTFTNTLRLSSLLAFVAGLVVDNIYMFAYSIIAYHISTLINLLGGPMTNKEIVLQKYPKAFVDKIYEEDDVTFDYGVIQEDSSVVIGAGKTKEEAWEHAATKVLIENKLY